MNHNITLLTVILAGIFPMSIHAVGTKLAGQTRELIVAAVTRSTGVGCRNVDSLTDNYVGLRDKAEFLALREQLKNSWETALSNMTVIAETDMEKAVLLYSFEGLSERDYVAFLRRAADLVEQGKLNRDIFYTVQCPLSENSEAWAVLVRSYNDADVKDVIMRSKKIFADQPARAARYDLMLSGESCKKLKKFETDHRDSKGSDANRGKQVDHRQTPENGGLLSEKSESGSGTGSGERTDKHGSFSPLAAAAIAALVGLSIIVVLRRLK